MNPLCDDIQSKNFNHVRLTAFTAGVESLPKCPFRKKFKGHQMICFFRFSAHFTSENKSRDEAVCFSLQGLIINDCMSSDHGPDANMLDITQPVINLAAYQQVCDGLLAVPRPQLVPFTPARLCFHNGSGWNNLLYGDQRELPVLCRAVRRLMPLRRRHAKQFPPSLPRHMWGRSPIPGTLNPTYVDRVCAGQVCVVVFASRPGARLCLPWPPSTPSSWSRIPRAGNSWNFL